ncbi:hypothetical protein PTKIN_Ptkin07bG0031000 [Pterospermum kingtungense]
MNCHIQNSQLGRAKWKDLGYGVVDFLQNGSIKIPLKTSRPRVAVGWIRPVVGSMTFNVDGSAVGKPGPAELLAIKEALSLFGSSPWANFHLLVEESDPVNAVKW